MPAHDRFLQAAAELDTATAPDRDAIFRLIKADMDRAMADWLQQHVEESFKYGGTVVPPPYTPPSRWRHYRAVVTIYLQNLWHALCGRLSVEDDG